MSRKTRSKVGMLWPIAALLLVAVYVTGSMGVLPLDRRIALMASVGLGVMGTVGCVAIGDLLGRVSTSFTARMGTVFGIIAFSIWVVVAVIQRGTPELWRTHVSTDLASVLPGGPQTVRQLYLGVSAIQATMDVAFDIFYCLAIVLFSSVMFGDPRFGRAIGVFGIASGGALLVLNLWTFPMPPSEAGFWDLGPLTGVWWIAVIIQSVRAPTPDFLPSRPPAD